MEVHRTGSPIPLFANVQWRITLPFHHRARVHSIVHQRSICPPAIARWAKRGGPNSQSTCSQIAFIFNRVASRCEYLIANGLPRKLSQLFSYPKHVVKLGVPVLNRG
jgi:hypothetical protein